MPETQTANPPSFESVWAALMETRDRQEEDRKRWKISMEELRESQKETDRQMKETDRKLKEFTESTKISIGSLTNLFGDLTEAMVAPKICEKFEEIGLSFPKANRNTRVNDWINKISFEVDIMLENGEMAMLIEAKTKMTVDRVNYHLNRMEKMRTYADLHGDKRVFFGGGRGHCYNR